MRHKSIPTLTPKQEVNFWAKVEVVPGCCWEWQGAHIPLGYGRLSLGTEYFYAHRVAYTILIGEIDPDLQLDHLCRNPKCVNPDHLEPVTSATNCKRRKAPTGFRFYPRKSSPTCGRGHVFTEATTYWTSRGTRICKECNRIRMREYMQKHRALAKSSDV